MTTGPIPPPLVPSLRESKEPHDWTSYTRPEMVVVGLPVVLLATVLGPIASLLLFLAGGMLDLCGARVQKLRAYGRVAAGAAAIPLMMYAILYGRPALWWLCLAITIAFAAHAVRPPDIGLRRILLTNVRNAALSVGIGVAAVLTMQLVLHHVGELHLELARAWTFHVGDARAWVEDVALLGPKQLAGLLLLLIAAAVIAPSLSVIRNYRRVALVASHSLLVLVVATSFVFFGNSSSRSAEWVARLAVGRDHLAAIDKSYQEVVKTAAVERTVSNLTTTQRALLVVLGQQIEKHTRSLEIRARLAARLLPSNVAADLAHHAEAARQQTAPSTLFDEHHRSQVVVETARQQIARSEGLRRDELLALKIERTRAQAYLQESRAALRKVVVDAAFPPLVNEMVQTMVETPLHGPVPPMGRTAALAAMSHALPEPPRVSFDRVIALPPLNPLDERGALELLAAATFLVQRTDDQIVSERQRAKDADRARKERSTGGGGGGGGSRVRRGAGGGGGGKSSSGGTTRSRGGFRFGVRGGGPLLVA